MSAGTETRGEFASILVANRIMRAPLFFAHFCTAVSRTYILFSGNGNGAAVSYTVRISSTATTHHLKRKIKAVFAFIRTLFSFLKLKFVILGFFLIFPLMICIDSSAKINYHAKIFIQITFKCYSLSCISGTWITEFLIGDSERFIDNHSSSFVLMLLKLFYRDCEFISQNSHTEWKMNEPVLFYFH